MPTPVDSLGEALRRIPVQGSPCSATRSPDAKTHGGGYVMARAADSWLNRP